MAGVIFTVEQTADYLKVCEKTVRRLINNKALTASKVGRSWRIQVSDIEKYLKNTQNQIGGGKNE